VVSVRLDESFVADGKWWLGQHEHLVAYMGYFVGDRDWMMGR